MRCSRHRDKAGPQCAEPAFCVAGASIWHIVPIVQVVQVRQDGSTARQRIESRVNDD